MTAAIGLRQCDLNEPFDKQSNGCRVEVKS